MTRAARFRKKAAERAAKKGHAFGPHGWKIDRKGRHVVICRNSPCLAALRVTITPDERHGWPSGNALIRSCTGENYRETGRALHEHQPT